MGYPLVIVNRDIYVKRMESQTTKISKSELDIWNFK